MRQYLKEWDEKWKAISSDTKTEGDRQANADVPHLYCLSSVYDQSLLDFGVLHVQHSRR